MGIATGAINEAVSLLDSLSPTRLDQLRGQHPLLAGDLGLGILAGADTEQPSDALLNEKAQIMIAALGEAWKAAEDALAEVSRRIKTARRERLISQVLVVIGSSSSLAAITLSQDLRPTAIAALLTLLAALGNLVAEYHEKLLTPQAGNIYDAFQKLGEDGYKARAASTDLTLALKYNETGPELRTLLASANQLCEQLNAGLIQLLNRIPKKPSHQ
jgi:hypothetical protein